MNFECRVMYSASIMRIFEGLVFDFLLAVQVARATHMALFVYQKSSAISQVCDADVDKLCLKSSPNLPQYPGRVLKCLQKAHSPEAEDDNGSEKKERKIEKLDENCALLLEVAEPPDEKDSFDKILQVCNQVHTI
jgi:hypothetical protein